MIDNDALAEALQMLRIGNNAIKEAQAKNLRNNIPNAHLIDGEFHFVMPNRNAHKQLVDHGFRFIFDRDIYIHPHKKTIISLEWIHDYPEKIDDIVADTHPTFQFYGVSDHRIQIEILDTYVDTSASFSPSPPDPLSTHFVPGEGVTNPT